MLKNDLHSHPKHACPITLEAAAGGQHLRVVVVRWHSDPGAHIRGGAGIILALVLAFAVDAHRVVGAPVTVVANCVLKSLVLLIGVALAWRNP